jgi:hypothetical protein
MSFLQPMLLYGLPLMALPIIIHLINQRRYQTVRWAAMMFLLAANRMSRGYARLRQWLIMAFRMLAIAALAFAVARPLAGGWLALTAGGRADTTIICLDRSPSMQQSSASGGGTKLETARQQLVRTLKTVGSGRWVLIEAPAEKPRELETADAVLNAPGTGPTSAASDIAGMLQVARDYIRANKTGRTEIWICSDVREDDWNADSGRWQSLRDSFLAVRVTGVRRQKAGDAAELLISLKLTREGGGDARESVPVHFEIEGARSELTVEMVGGSFELKDHRITLEKGRERGWGKVSIPADANPADNDFYFAFDQPPARHAIVVAEDALAARPLQLAAAIAPDPALRCSAEVVATEGLAAVEWEKVSLLLWQAPLPEGETAKLVQSFIDRGGHAIFFPPRNLSSVELFGARWKVWVDENKEVPVENWRGDQDLLSHTQSGTPLPVGQLQVRRYCGLGGEFTQLATLRGGAPLLAKVTTNRGGVYFCATTPGVGDSSLAMGGVVLYVLVQRASSGGAAALANTRDLVAGEPTGGEDPAKWKPLATTDDAISTDYPLHRGVYSSGDRLLAVNRPASEDVAPVLADRKLSELFRGLDFVRVDDEAGNYSALVQEIWRLFLIAMIVAMVVEAGLCLPKKAPRPVGVATA